MTTTHETVESLIGVASRLIALMQHEVAVLRDMRPRDIEALQAEKAALAESYEAHVRALAEMPDALAGIGPVLRAEFVRVAAEFEAALAENERALHAARTAQGRLIKAIVDAVGGARGKSSGYCADGGRVGAARRDPVLSLAFDATL